MSQQELEQGDLEVMGMVNGHSHPDAAAAAEEIADADWIPAVEEECEGRIATSPAAPRNDRVGCEPDVADVDAQYLKRCREDEKLYRKHQRIEALKAALFVAACLGTAAALVAAWYVPKLQVWVMNIGVLACGIAAAVKIDRWLRIWADGA